MQIIDTKGNILYSIEQSELFPDYRSVLLDAIANGIDLTNLSVENQNLQKIYFQGVNLCNASFKNCDMRGVEFINCIANDIDFDQCNLIGLKIKKSNFCNSGFNRSNISNASIGNSELNESWIKNSNLSNTNAISSNFISCAFYDCNLESSKFSQAQAENISFHTCNLKKTVFERCSLMNANLIHTSSTFEWLQDVTFAFCNISDCDLSRLPNLSMLFINESNIHEAILDHQTFTKIINKYTTVLYAIDSDTVWWDSFRGTFEEFRVEVETGFPQTNVDIGVEIFIYSELSKVLVYLEQWKNHLII